LSASRATSADTSTDTVLVSMKTAPGLALASTPSGPSAIARNVASSGMLENTRSASRAHSARFAASRAPRAASLWRLAAVREHTSTG
jgi:hypothetical protein